MSGRSKHVIGIVSGTIFAAIILMWVVQPRHNFHWRVVSVEEVIVGGPWLIELELTNSGRHSVKFDRYPRLEAKVKGKWAPLEGVGYGMGRREAIGVASGTEAVRLRTKYQMPLLKVRLFRYLTLGQKQWLARQPLWLRKLVWPDQYRAYPTPPRWKPLMLEAVVPTNKIVLPQ